MGGDVLRRETLSPDEQAGACALAAVAAQALARAGLYQAEHDMASALQRALLPQQLPELDFATVAGRYLPARQDMEVGGDWYDVIPLPDGDVAVVIGDVQGHSTAAAAVMGQVRNTLRAYALEGHAPATVVGQTNRLLCQLQTSLFATCCYVALHPGTGTADVVRAGHHQPMLLPGTEPPRFLDVAGGLPLGIDVEELYPTAAVSLRAGDVLALYTDGLVEPPGVADGAARLLAHAATLHTRGADGVAAALLELTEQAEGQPDDVALLVLNFTGRDALRTGRVADLELPAAPSSPGAARSWLRQVLCDWELTPVVDVGELLLSEVITNAVTHGEGAVGVRLREVDSRLRVEVTDGSSRRPVRREIDGEVTSGRGLVLLDALASDWGVEPRGDSKCVWFDLDTSG